MAKKSLGSSGPSTLMIQNKTLKKELAQAKGRLRLLESQLRRCSCGAANYYEVDCPRCAYRIVQTSPIIKQPCPSCQTEGICVLLSSPV